MLEACMSCSWIYHRCESELVDAIQALEQLVLHDIAVQSFSDFYKTENRVVDDGISVHGQVVFKMIHKDTHNISKKQIFCVLSFIFVVPVKTEEENKPHIFFCGLVDYVLVEAMWLVQYFMI